MIIRVGAEALEAIDLDPELEADEIGQNVAALAVTPKGSVPLARGMGLAMAFRDRPGAAATRIYENEIAEAVDAYEKRATVTGAAVAFDEGTGRMIPEVEVVLNGG